VIIFWHLQESVIVARWLLYFRERLNHRLARTLHTTLTDESLSLGKRNWKRNYSAHERAKGSLACLTLTNHVARVNEAATRCLSTRFVVAIIICLRRRKPSFLGKTLSRDANLAVFRSRTLKFFPVLLLSVTPLSLPSFCCSAAFSAIVPFAVVLRSFYSFIRSEGSRLIIHRGSSGSSSLCLASVRSSTSNLSLLCHWRKRTKKFCSMDNIAIYQLQRIKMCTSRWTTAPRVTRFCKKQVSIKGIRVLNNFGR